MFHKSLHLGPSHKGGAFQSLCRLRGLVLVFNLVLILADQKDCHKRTVLSLGGTTSTKRSQNGPMEPPNPDGPLPLGPPVPTDINQKVNQLLQTGHQLLLAKVRMLIGRIGIFHLSVEP